MGRLIQKRGSQQATMTTEEYLTRALEGLHKKLRLNANLTQETNNAKLLEDFFNTVAGYSTNHSNIASIVSSKNIQEGLKSLPNLNQLQMNNNYKPVKDEFEEWIARVIDTAFSDAKANNLIDYQEEKSGTYVLGKDRVDLTKNLKGVKSKAIAIAYRAASQKAKEDAEKYRAKHKDLNTVTVQGKIDVATNYADLTISSDNKYLQRMFKLLKNTSFTAKSDISSKSITLGNTNLFRVYSAISAEVRNDEMTKIDRFHRLLNCIDNHRNGHRLSHEMNALLLYKVRFAYELTGHGLVYAEDRINRILGGATSAKYIAYHNAGSDRIEVVSTRALLKDLFDILDEQNKEGTSAAISMYDSQKIAMDPNLAKYGAIKLAISKKHIHPLLTR